MNILSYIAKQDKFFNEVVHGKLKNKKVISGVTDSCKDFIISEIIKNNYSPILIVTYNDVQAKLIHDDLKFFMDFSQHNEEREIKLLLARPNILYNIDAGTQDVFSNRQQAIIGTIDSENSIMITSIEAFTTCLIPKEEYIKYIVNLQKGQSIDVLKFEKEIFNAGYSFVDIVTNKGQISKKGGIYDIYPLNYDCGVRVELFDDEIESIRLFDISTQRSISETCEVTIYPARELVYDEKIKEEACEALKTDIEAISSKISKTEEKNNFLERFNRVYDNLKNNVHIEGIEKYIGYFYKNTATILDYMGKDTFVIVDEPNRIKQRYETISLEFNEIIKSLIEKGLFLDKYYNILNDYQTTVESILKHKSIIFNYLGQSIKDFSVIESVNLEQKIINSFEGRFKDLIQELKDNLSKKYFSLIICATIAQAERVKEEFSENKLEAIIFNMDLNNEDEIDEYLKNNYNKVFITIGGIHKGFELNGLSVINYSDIFGNPVKKRKKEKIKNGEKISSFTDLKVGDYVVHANHGIGIYTGIEQIVVDKVTKDYLKLKYSDDGSLYVPINQLDMVQKYVATGDREPKLNKLDSTEWNKAKNKVKKSVEDIAEKLIELYAQRQSVEGYKYSKDNIFQRQFEDMFPYQETDDQIQSISEIKQDMEEKKVMDRLLCGDVGYGKTEVAMRAAFKAVQDKKQVAYLVPTTVLANQQYMSFRTRFKEFPINIEVLSRFKTPSEQKEILSKAKIGDLDILIGTHRLLQKDVKFKDLGLIIIDEEQRFGVKHKEKLKELKKNVDVLTLTATPIPRTLHMSMIGIRDISVIEEPPQDRHPVQTYVMEDDDEVIKDAIIREMARGGQVFYVYNRVESIEECASRLKKLIPDLRICVIHGQTTPVELEDRIMSFLSGEYDVLVCTTIIETGIDMPNVNTLIVENADRFGLSQLYQLRGRVGRSNKIAYAYFTYKKDKVLTEVAEKRLQAIKEFTEFGSGFKIALRDLEIRGAGNLLGSQQHGQMEAVGYDMYCHLLEKAVSRLKGNEVEEDIDTLIDLSISSFIPSDYIKDEIQKIEMYKKVASIEDEGDIISIKDEFNDRFGDIPEQVENLITVAYIKSLAKRAYIEGIIQRGSIINLEFVNNKFDPSIINKLAIEHGNSIRVVPSKKKPTIQYILGNQKKETIFEKLKSILRNE